jgi:long-chain acyl-CoA synthetase
MDKIWLNSYPPGVPKEIDANALGSISDYVDTAFAKYPQRKAFISGSTGVALTYQQLDILSLQVAAYFQSVLKLPKGARVALMIPNLLQYPVCLFGILRAGYVVVNVNPMYTPRELEHQLKDSGAEAMVVVEMFAHTLAKVIATTSVKHVVVTALTDMMPWAKRVIGNFLIRHVKKAVPPYSLPGSTNLRDAMAMGSQAVFHPVTFKADDLAILQYTGGTTGVSKGAMLTHRNVLSNVEQGRVWFDPIIDKTEAMIGITAIPLYHIYALGTCLSGLNAGGTNVLVSDPRNIPAFVKVLSQYKFASLPAVNTLFIGLLNDPNFAKLDFSKLIFGVGGGAATQRTVAEQWQQVTGKPLLEGFGLTECSPTVSVNPYNTNEFRGGIGFPLPSTEVSIRNEEGTELPIGQPGELCVRGPQVMKGYWQRPQETAAVMTADGFLRTGDIAVMEIDGYMKIVDRIKDMILVSGFNVYPNEVEEVVMSHPGVLEVAAVGKKSNDTGEKIKLFVVKKSPALTQEMLIAHCRENLTAYKVPREVEFLDELPKSPVGKVLRRELRERG